MGEVAARKDELDAAADIVVICHHGGRSMQVAMFLEKNGFARVHNLAGGVDAWARTVEPAMPVY
jgi:rhodanese-related sulfurtransferase